ncbi:MAG: WbqC family protein [Prevotellaceae bacterium]|nr:WbqC family protein [Prevotellaceae bacterium]
MTAYLAPVSYYSRLARHVTPHCEARFLSRCRILSPLGPLTLSIPLQHTHHGADIRDIRISEHARWRHRHWNALRSAYGRSPYFQFYEDDLAPIFEKRWDFLADLNETLQNLVCSLLGIQALPIPPQRGRTLRSRDNYVGVSIACKPYTQVFSTVFLPDLSIVDLLCNMGPESVLYL